MNTQIQFSDFQRVIEQVETLTIDDQFLLVDIIRQRLSQYRRSQLIAEVAEARQAYQAGNVQRGTVDDLLFSSSSFKERNRVQRKFTC